MPGHILVATAGRSGLLYSSVELGRRLAAAGHRVTYAGPASARDLVESHGLGFLAVDPSHYDRFLEADTRRGTLTRISNLSRRRQQAAASVAVDGWIEAVRDLEPDLLLIDGEMHEHIIAASGTGVPIALLNTFASIWRRPGLPPPHHMVRPGAGWKGTRVGISMLWLALRLRKSMRAASQRVRRVGCDRLSILHHLARQAGFDLRRETDDSQWLIPFTYRRLPVLSLHAVEFEFPHRPPARVHYVGPMVLEARNDHLLTAEEGARLDALFEQRRSDGNRKLIYAGFGSVFSTEIGFLRRLIEAIAQRPDWNLVISLGDQVASAELGELPDRVLALPWIPQLSTLSRADVCVTHGGINTLDECVLHGVPLLVYCGWETDMAGSTARVVHHGIGIAGDRSRDGVAQIGQHIDRLLLQHEFHGNLKRLRDAYLAYAENRVAERIVGSIIDNVSGSPEGKDLASPGGLGS